MDMPAFLRRINVNYTHDIGLDQDSDSEPSRTRTHTPIAIAIQPQSPLQSQSQAQVQAPNQNQNQAQSANPNPNPNPTHTITRSNTLWFEDGTIVLQAESTQFRVYLGLLSLNSKHPVFHGEQPGPGLQYGVDEVEGCPVMTVNGTAEDWEQVLLTIHHWHYNLTSLNIRSDFSAAPHFYPIYTLVSLLRVGHVYQFDTVVSVAVRVMKELFSCNLEDFDAAAKPPTLWLRHSDNYPYGWQMEVINVALEVPGLMSILPSVYVLCLQDLGLDVIFDGIECHGAKRIELSHATQATLAKAREQIVHASINALLLTPLVLPNFAYQCGDLQGCLVKRNIALNRRAAEILATFAENGVKDNGFCAYCQQIVDRRTQEGRKTMWARLPSFFGLPEWHVLKELDERSGRSLSSMASTASSDAGR
ncbi:hypothetical protein JR316_0005552 [Psilocybe cubensis]|uniref:BTB domain-containing protein n=2 Tax=Psilocybe cubensis TaxID=181762 RepID=A0A8H7Y2J8_PSICU|nr:hypothetical protein JR316_0005552 [Psilocybe cubensis]KAH9481033.1 hypothetical protein JR316_0005552 [Psilocybe cubensis]